MAIGHGGQWYLSVTSISDADRQLWVILDFVGEDVCISLGWGRNPRFVGM